MAISTSPFLRAMSPTCLILCCEWMLVAILKAEYHHMYLIWPDQAGGRFKISCLDYPPTWRQLCKTQTRSSHARRCHSTPEESQVAMIFHHPECIWKVARTCPRAPKWSTRSDFCRRSTACSGLRLSQGWTSSSRSSATGNSCPGW